MKKSEVYYDPKRDDLYVLVDRSDIWPGYWLVLGKEAGKHRVYIANKFLKDVCTYVGTL